MVSSNNISGSGNGGDYSDLAARARERGLNSAKLKDERLVEVIVCEHCRKYNIVFSDPDHSRWRNEQCHFCFKGLDRSRKVGDSHNPELYPEWAFDIRGKTPKGYTYIQPYALTTCPNCLEQQYIPYAKGAFKYDECICHTRLPSKPTVRRPAALAPVPAGARPDEFTVKVPGDLVGPLKDYVFSHDVTRSDAAVRGLRLLLKAGEAR
jgi:hypothetical protein